MRIIDYIIVGSGLAGLYTPIVRLPAESRTIN